MLMKSVILLVCLAAVSSQRRSSSHNRYYRASSPFTYLCRAGKCVKVDRQDAQSGNSQQQGLSLDRCKLTCGPYGQLWPKPSGKVTIGKDVVSFLPQHVEIKSMTAPTEDLKNLLNETTQIFMNQIKWINPQYKYKGESAYDNETDYSEHVRRTVVYVELSVVSNVMDLELHQDESYTIGLNNVNGNILVNILANTFFGARHGLQTLTQLIAYDCMHNALMVVDRAIVIDKPVFTYRAVTLDTSRNFFSIASLKKMVDAMSYNKLNVLHWHITDTHSFPFFTNRVPQMVAYGAYSPYQVYYPEDVIELVRYARVRGVRIVPELDAPAHVGNGWQWAEKEGRGRMAVCVNQEPWQNYCVQPPCGQLNPLHEGMYNVLGDIYKDFLDVFQTDLFHMGGDEVNFNCWNTTQEIVDWMVTKRRRRTKRDFLDLWNSFQVKAYDKLAEANQRRVRDQHNNQQQQQGQQNQQHHNQQQQNQNQNKMKVILWTSELTNRGNLAKYLDPEKYIIQIWSQTNDSVIAHIVNQGFQVIFTPYDTNYLDCGFGAWVGEGNNWCSPYKGWKTIYNMNPFKVLRNLNVSLDNPQVSTRAPIVTSPSPRDLVLGGAVAMWSEQVDEHSVESKVWPRAAALAERMWSNPESDWKAAEGRFINNRERMVNLGIGADAEQPRWCHQNDGLCYL